MLTATESGLMPISRTGLLFLRTLQMLSSARISMTLSQTKPPKSWEWEDMIRKEATAEGLAEGRAEVLSSMPHQD